MKTQTNNLAPETLIEVIAVNKKTLKASKKIMSYQKATQIKKNRGFFYYFYQLGFSQFDVE